MKCEETRMVSCQCGEIMGEMCEWVGPLTDAVVVEYMPACRRDSHTAAGNSGSWPHNGSTRLVMSRECAERAVEGDEEWTTITDRDPARYI